jgi:peptidoglycan/LPS O-acetylase OafA/YrhL
VQLLTALLGVASTAYWAVGPWLFPNYWWWGLTRAGSELLVQNGCAFALGVFLWLILTRGWTWLRGAVALVCSGGMVLEIIHTSANHAEVLRDKDPGPWIPLAVTFVSVVLIVGAVRVHRRIEDALSPRAARWIRRLGLATYPTYLLHTVSGGAILYALTRAGWPPVAAFLTAFATCVGLGLAIALGPEVWVRRGLSALLGGARPRPVAHTGAD